MNNTKIKKKRNLLDISFYVLIGIIAAAILFGFLYDIIVGETEKRLYPRRYSAFVTLPRTHSLTAIGRARDLK